MDESRGIASGIRVVEIGSSVSVAIAGMTLADAGAEVISVERPGDDSLREQAAFAMWGRGKRSVVADLSDRSSAGDRERALAWVREADVLLIGLKPASVERLGLSYEALVAESPGLVYASVTGFGSKGPFRDIPVYDAVMQARGGRMYEFSTMHEGARPAFAAAPVAAHGAAMALLAGALGALRERRRNGGRGQRVETSLARALAVYDLAGWIPGGPAPLRLEDVPFLPYAVARTADGVWIQFAQNGPALFGDFLKVLGLDGEINYLEAMTPAADSQVKRDQRMRIQARIAEHSWAEWQARFRDEHNLAAEPFHAPGEALCHPQFEAIGDVIEWPNVEGRMTRQLGPLFDVPSHPLVPQGPAPTRDNAGAGFTKPVRDRCLRAPETSEGTDRTKSETDGMLDLDAGPGLLSGVTILELGMWIALPFAATQLAELGARVIKLEPLGGDPMRTTGPVAYKIVQGKESIALDMKRPEAQEIVHRWVEKADVVLHSYRPGVPERLGIDFETLRKINPRLVYLYNGSYGSRGPKSYAPAFHVTGGAVAGGAYAQAGKGCPPEADVSMNEAEMARVSRRLELANEANPDFNSAATATAAVMLGLLSREQTGAAIEIETRMMLSNAMMMSADFVDDPDRSRPREVDSDLNGLGPLYQLYAASEGWVFLAAPRESHFVALCRALDLAELLDDPRFATPSARALPASEDALASRLGEAFSKRSAADWEADLCAQGIACVRADEGPYRSWLFEQDWAREQGLVSRVEDSMDGSYLRYGAAVVNDRPVPLRGAFPAGRETRDLLAEIGYSAEETEHFIAEGVVAEALEA